MLRNCPRGELLMASKLTLGILFCADRKFPLWPEDVLPVLLSIRMFCLYETVLAFPNHHAHLSNQIHQFFLDEFKWQGGREMSLVRDILSSRKNLVCFVHVTRSKTKHYRSLSKKI